MSEEKDLVIDMGLEEDYDTEEDNPDLFISDEEFRENIGIAIHAFQFIEDIGNTHIKILQSGLTEAAAAAQTKCLEIVFNSIDLIHRKTSIEDGE